MDRGEIASHSLGKFGEIRYVDLPRGYIRIVNDFCKKYLVKVELPYVGKKWLHKAMVEPLVTALEIIEHHSQYDMAWEYIEGISIFNPRHQWYKTNKPLSRHAFGLACDINHWENLPGTRGTIPIHIVEVFERCGFDWGGRWQKRDSMHFEIHV